MSVKNEAENNTHSTVEIDVTNDLKHLSDPRIKRIKEILTQKHYYNAKYLQQLTLFASSLIIVYELKGCAFE